LSSDENRTEVSAWFLANKLALRTVFGEMYACIDNRHQ